MPPSVRYAVGMLAVWLFATPPASAAPPESAFRLARERVYAELEREAADVGPFVNVVKKVVKLVKPAVVHIEAEKHSTTDGGRRRVEESGSGVIVEMGGKPYAVTNRHVIRDTDTANIKIKLEDGRQVSPTKILTDPKTDVAVMALPGERMASLRLGDSDRMEIGDFVIAVGSPFGLSHSVTLGIISARDRRNLALGAEGLKYQDFIQTDAAINPGNSGGPLINLRGEVIGINTAIATESGKNQGIGFAIPANMLRVVVQQLVERGQVQRAFLGVNLDGTYGPTAATRLGLPRPIGALVRSITPRSPAESAKILPGDVILQFNGRSVDDDSHLINMVSLTPVDTEVPVILYREGKQVKLTVKVGDRSNFLPEE
jgi:serine protease Do